MENGSSGGRKERERKISKTNKNKNVKKLKIKNQKITQKVIINIIKIQEFNFRSYLGSEYRGARVRFILNTII